MSPKSRFKGWTVLYTGLVVAAFLTVLFAKSVTVEAVECRGKHPQDMVITGTGCSEDDAWIDWLSKAVEFCENVCSSFDCQECKRCIFKKGRLRNYDCIVISDSACSGGERFECSATVTRCKCKCVRDVPP